MAPNKWWQRGLPSQLPFLLLHESTSEVWVAQMLSHVYSLWPHGVNLCDFSKNTGMGYYALLQGNLPTPGIKSISAAQILYHWATWEALALEDVPQIYTQGWSRRSSTYRQYLPFRKVLRGPCPEGTTSSFNSWVSPLLLLQLLWAVSFHSLFLDHTPCDVLGSASFSFP